MDLESLLVGTTSSLLRRARAPDDRWKQFCGAAPSLNSGPKLAKEPMPNDLPPALATGTLGEILVQLRLLQFGVQAAPPMKDTGTDLVAFRGRTVRTIQVKTAINRVSRDRRVPPHYDVLALVLLRSDNGIVELDASRIFLISKNFAQETRRGLHSLATYELCHNNVDRSMSLLSSLFPASTL